MAVPNLSNVDWGKQMANQSLQKQNEFNLQFANALLDSASKIKPVMQYDGSNLSFSSGDETAKSRDDLWNSYVKNAEAWGVTPDTSKFENEIMPFYKSKTTKNFMDSIYRMQLDPDIAQEDYNNLYRNNPEYKKMIENAYIDALNSGDTQTRDSLHALIPSGDGEGLVNWVTENPLMAAGAATGVYQTGKYLKGTKKGGKFFKGKGGPLAIAAGLGIPMLAGSMGATESEQKALGIAGCLGIGGYYGKQVFDTVARGRYARQVSGVTKADLIKRAKALGITVDSKDTAENLAEKGNKKVKGQSIRETKKATGIKPTFKAKQKIKYKLPKIKGGGPAGMAASFILGSLIE